MRPEIQMTMAVSAFCCVQALAAAAVCGPAPSNAISEFTWKASWIWGPERPHGSTGCFRKTFEVGEGLQKAEVQLSGDDNYTFYVNGKVAHKGGFWWRTTNRVDVTGLLHPGKNVFAAQLRNAAGYGGLLLEACLVYSEDRFEVIASDKNWLFRPCIEEGWLAVDFDDSAWSMCEELGSPPERGPWGEMPHYYLGPRTPVELVEASCPKELPAGERLALELKVELLRSLKRDCRLYVKLTLGERVFLFKEWLPKEATSTWQAGKTYSITTEDLRLSRYLPSGEYSVECGVATTRYTNTGREGHCIGSVIVLGLDGKRLVTPTEVKGHNGAPTLFVGGKPVFPMWIYQNKPLEEDVVNFAAVGVNTFTFGMPLGWAGEGKYDYSEVDKVMLDFLNANPNGYAVPRVYLCAPRWWLDKHPDELVRYADGVGWINNSWGGTRHESFASGVWLKEAGDAFENLVEHILNSAYSDRVIGYHITNGIYGEWHAWSATNVPDTSECMRAALIEYVREKYHGSIADLRAAWGEPEVTFDAVSVPTLAERNSGDDGAFRNPVRSRRISDYYECYHRKTVEAMTHFCKIVKSKGELLTLVFYSYSPDLHWPQEGDHRAAALAHAEPAIDSFSSPHTYCRRQLGGDGMFRNFPAAMRLQGKLFIDEGDGRTHLANDPGHTYVSNLEQSVSVLRRQFTNALTSDCGLWYMDQQGDWFHHPKMVAEIGKMHRWGQLSVKIPRGNAGREVAVVSALQSEFYMANRTSGSNNVCSPLYTQTIGEIARTGAPFDWYLIENLEDGLVPPHKAYIFLDCFYLTKTQRDAVELLKMENRLLLWIYAPGYVTESELSVQAMNSLTGLDLRREKPGPLMVTCSTKDVGVEFGVTDVQDPRFYLADTETTPLGLYTDTRRTALGYRKFDNWTSAFCGVPNVRADVLRRLFVKAGVHVYCDAGDPVTANAHWLAIHTRTAGLKRFVLPSASPVYDVFSDRLISKDVREFSLCLRAYETRLFFLGDPDERVSEDP